MTGSFGEYPERDSNPHDLRQGVLSPFQRDGAATLSAIPDEGASSDVAECSGSFPLPATDPATAKKCPRCGEVKPRAAFASRRNGQPQPYCRPCATAKVNEWLQRPGRREMLYAATNASKARYPEKEAARRLFREAVRVGRLAPGPCEVGTDCRGKIAGHHDDYGRPLDVRWLCRKHHEQLHHGTPEVAA